MYNDERDEWEEDKMTKPIIGITTLMIEDERFVLNKKNNEAIQQAGGVPIMLPHECEHVERYAEMIDGLLLTGGHDVDPYYYGEEPHEKISELTPTRDAFELALTQLMLAKNKPVFGICRGSQMLNVAAGGTLIQDIPSAVPDAIQHVQTTKPDYPIHSIRLLEQSKLGTTLEKEAVRVNSFHHQAVKELGDGFYATAWASDGIIEAIESANYKFALGVQWHPELTINADGEQSNRLFEAFIEACRVP